MDRVEIILGDITLEKTDAIVNAANSALLGGGGVDGAIHRAAGPGLLEECRTLGGCPTGDARMTDGYRLPARWVIHTVGPMFSPHEDRSPMLRAAYTRSLAVADGLGARTVAFPLISAGAYGWPREDAIRQAVTALTSARTAVEIVTLVAYDRSVAELMRRSLP